MKYYNRLRENLKNIFLSNVVLKKESVSFKPD